jgi:hypothetical protein
MIIDKLKINEEPINKFVIIRLNLPDLNLEIQSMRCYKVLYRLSILLLFFKYENKKAKIKGEKIKFPCTFSKDNNP